MKKINSFRTLAIRFVTFVMVVAIFTGCEKRQLEQRVNYPDIPKDARSDSDSCKNPSDGFRLIRIEVSGPVMEQARVRENYFEGYIVPVDNGLSSDRNYYTGSLEVATQLRQDWIRGVSSFVLVGKNYQIAEICGTGKSITECDGVLPWSKCE